MQGCGAGVGSKVCVPCWRHLLLPIRISSPLLPDCLQPGLAQINFFVRLNASDKAAYEAFIASQLSMPVEAVAVKSYAGPSATEYAATAGPLHSLPIVRTSSSPHPANI
jgi:hypothetical protein